MAEKMIFVVDDDLSTRLYLEQVLRAEGYAVFSAANGREALTLLETRRPDLFLLDVEMPEMGGYEFLDVVRATKKTAQIPAIFLTVRDTSEDEARGLKEGVVDYLSKEILTPDRVQLLCYRLRNFFTWQENERLRGVLATIVSANHEINNPLMVIQGGADLLRLKGIAEGQPETGEALVKISDACQRIKGVLKQISTLGNWGGTSYLDGVEMLDLDSDK